MSDDMTGRPLTAREFASLLDPNAQPYIPELDDQNDDQQTDTEATA